MCGRITNGREDRTELAHELGVRPETVPADFRPRYNIAPMQNYFLIRMHQEERELLVARWGLVNRWAKDNSQSAHCINAKAETVEIRPAFRDAFRKRRCVVPCDGFYEWTGPKNDRVPLWFYRPYGQLLMLAGLYESWQKQPGEWETTFTIITCGPNELTRPIHDRMPVVLPEDVVDEWLDPANPPLLELEKLLVPAGEDVLVCSEASRLANSGQERGSGPACRFVKLAHPHHLGRSSW
jgi:putative SOS response-associated peptidase YedK